MIDDQVCGTEVYEGATALAFIYKGKTYYHRAPGCRGAFHAPSEKLLAEKRSRRRAHYRIYPVAETDVGTLHPCFPLPASVKRAAPYGNAGSWCEAIV